MAFQSVPLPVTALMARPGNGEAATGLRPIPGDLVWTTLLPILVLSRNILPARCGRTDFVTQTTLTLTSSQHVELLRHLFPDDGCEAVALILCGRRADPARHRLLARRVIPVPYDACSVRLPNRVTWSTSLLPPILEEASKFGMALIKVHPREKRLSTAHELLGLVARASYTTGLFQDARTHPYTQIPFFKCEYG